MTPRRRGRPAKSSFYHTRWNRVKLNIDRAAAILGVSATDIEEFDRSGNPLAERYLLLWDKKHVSHEGWQGWYFSRGTLHYRGLQWRPENILHDRQFRESIESESYTIMRQFHTQTVAMRLEDASGSRTNPSHPAANNRANTRDRR